MESESWEDFELSLDGLISQQYVFLSQSRGAGPTHLPDKGDSCDAVEIKLHSIAGTFQPGYCNSGRPELQPFDVLSNFAG